MIQESGFSPGGDPCESPPEPVAERAEEGIDRVMEIQMLVATAGLALFLLIPNVLGMALTPGGLIWGAGNREAPLEKKGFALRAQRAHLNLLESLPIFTALVLAVVLQERTTPQTALACQAFFGARVLHAAVYLAGIPHIRTLIFVASVVCMLYLGWVAW